MRPNRTYTVEEHLDTEVRRLNALQAVAWPQRCPETWRALVVAVRVLEVLCRLLGLTGGHRPRPVLANSPRRSSCAMTTAACAGAPTTPDWRTKVGYTWHAPAATDPLQSVIHNRASTSPITS